MHRKNRLTRYLPVSIVGNGTLDITAKGKCTGISCTSTCIVEGPTLTCSCESAIPWVGGALSRDRSLTVNGAETRLSLIPGDDNFPPLYWLNSLTLGSGLYVTQPWGGYFDNGKGHITLDDDSPYGKLVISSSHGVHGDMNGDGIVDVSDIAKIINIIGTKARKAESPVE